MIPIEEHHETGTYIRFRNRQPRKRSGNMSIAFVTRRVIARNMDALLTGNSKPG